MRDFAPILVALAVTVFAQDSVRTCAPASPNAKPEADFISPGTQFCQDLFAKGFTPLIETINGITFSATGTADPSINLSVSCGLARVVILDGCPGDLR